MPDSTALNLRLGIASLLASGFLFFYAIPRFVSAPSNINNIVLSPLFWPYILSVLTALVGLGLIAVSITGEPEEDGFAEPGPMLPKWGRLAALALIMAATFLLLPALGMVWTSMLAFLATAFLFRTRHPVAAVICAVLIPLVLYGFFAHVAGVAVPQGNFVRLP
ncbi:tripartite tricarboxylate transporter TctB family protein [Marivita sp. GX14005]|uniref:tripartite tricarboxylate transporter TctB family protein n=1 Tax=Marivita sp. GX14005 TaxID=2942276 RepID=UPI00201A1A13|nr:tripartite tricarboxylate transporter TctB family protein [Marivita sp. GX14005]MCL3882960.1 tripartite tricarboxylate transporter TctB family protein [Marivita sp. GX14005]